MAMILLIFGVFTSAAAFEMDLDKVSDGTYLGESEGAQDKIELEVVVEGGEITAIEVISQNETPNKWEYAEQTLNDIVENQSINVDTETGATYSSEAIVAAVQNALEVEIADEELPETGGGILPLLSGVGVLVAAGGATLIAKRKS